MTESEWYGLKRGVKIRAELLVDKNIFEIIDWDMIFGDYGENRNVYYVFNPKVPYVKTASTIGAWSKLS